MKTSIDRHASVVLVHYKNRLVTNQYDDTYPLEAYRKCINLIGGTPNKDDKSPLETLLRELAEEFRIETEQVKEFDPALVKTLGSGPPAPQVTRFASESDIEQVKESIIRTLVPYRDVILGVPAYPPRPTYKILFHVYAATISEEVVTTVRRNLDQHKSLVSEGFLRLTDLHEVQNGTIGTAWATGPVLGSFFKAKMPNPDGITAEEIGLPRESYNAYESDFLIKKK